tara:strand:- start:125 stop:973 length:849 start_codon:yes stop_codon:yes gene_type:complete
LEGVSYEKTPKELKKITADDSLKGLVDVDSSQYFSDTSAFVRADDYIDPEQDGNTTPRYRSFFNKIDKFIDTPVIQSLVDRAADKFKKASASDLSNIEGSLAAGELNLAPRNLQTMNSFEKNIMFNSVVRVEYLRGYRNGVREPEWSLVTGALLDLLRQKKSSVLCRLSLPNRALNVENRYELSQYDSLFVLGFGPLKSRHPQNNTAVLDGLHQKVVTALTRLNPKAAGGSLLAQYTCSKMMIYDSGATPQKSPARPASRRSRPVSPAPAPSIAAPPMEGNY